MFSVPRAMLVVATTLVAASSS
ncbi:MAG: hypothetical protein RL005_441, partial [Planctomycetota bacterium]